MCYFCGEKTEGPVYRNSTCPACGKDLKICLNCKFYEPGAHWDCRETISEPVREKDRANFCDYFVLTHRTAKSGPSDKSAKAKDLFNSLFSDE